MLMWVSVRIITVILSSGRFAVSVSVWVKALEQNYRMMRFETEKKKNLKYGGAWSQKNGVEESKIFALTPGVFFMQRYCTL
jgi:hypothetical protein